MFILSAYTNGIELDRASYPVRCFLLHIIRSTRVTMLCRRTLRMLHIGSSTQHLHGGASFICATDWGRDALLRLNQPVARHSHRWRAGKIGQRKQFMLAPYKPGFPTTPPLEEVMNLSTWFPMASEIWAENYAIRYYFLIFLFWSSHYFGDIPKDTWVGTL